MELDIDQYNLLHARKSLYYIQKLHSKSDGHILRNIKKEL